MSRVYWLIRAISRDTFEKKERLLPLYYNDRVKEEFDNKIEANPIVINHIGHFTKVNQLDFNSHHSLFAVMHLNLIYSIQSQH